MRWGGGLPCGIERDRWCIECEVRQPPHLAERRRPNRVAADFFVGV